MKRGEKRRGGRPHSGEAFRFTSRLERSDNRLWGCHLQVPDRIAKRVMEQGSRRVVCTLNGTAEHQCAVIPRRHGSFVITVNKKLREMLGLSFGENVLVSLRKDETTYGLPFPDELKELLQQDKEGNALFHSLTRGRQRTLLYIVGSVKGSEKRLARANVVVNHLKANNGKINYRRLYQSLRAPRS